MMEVIKRMYLETGNLSEVTNWVVKQCKEAHEKLIEDLGINNFPLEWLNDCIDYTIYTFIDKGLKREITAMYYLKKMYPNENWRFTKELWDTSGIDIRSDNYLISVKGVWVNQDHIDKLKKIEETHIDYNNEEVFILNVTDFYDVVSVVKPVDVERIFKKPYENSYVIDSIRKTIWKI